MFFWYFAFLLLCVLIGKMKMQMKMIWIIGVGVALLIWLAFNYAQLTRNGPPKMHTTENGELQNAFSESCKSSSIGVYLHFLWIFAGIYALSKLTELCERYLWAKIAVGERNCDVRVLDGQWEQTLKLYEQDKQRLAAELSALREKNSGLELLLGDLRDCNLQLISANFMRCLLQDQRIQGLAQRVQDQQQQSNIYITNRHIHLTRQVFLNDGHFDRDAADPLQMPEKSMNVWIKYLKMSKCYTGPIAEPQLVLNGANGQHILPIVMTTEQLAKLQGMT